MESEEEGEGNDVLSEDARRKMVEERMNPKRECPIPKPGGLVGQVLGMTGRPEGVTAQVERLRRTGSGNNQ